MLHMLPCWWHPNPFYAFVFMKFNFFQRIAEKKKTKKISSFFPKENILCLPEKESTKQKKNWWKMKKKKKSTLINPSLMWLLINEYHLKVLIRTEI